MLHITSLDEGLEIFKALGSDVRIQILNILLENSNMSMKDLAARLNITNGALTGHIKKLEELWFDYNISRICSAWKSKNMLCSLGQNRYRP